ncbi:CesT family type III secretion system chaperone [Rhizobium oryzicola]|uniref:CesT family type III secretion system chaperone n=1 Tax=Rhizobium oryzicola TaxID=1232668 RepID=A0ABT8SVF4_9HYPH|nr:CesT family type III secretion system chaperone [Rhizobium oryzicola]MDO1581873.1 CesT family type III secretion system chaperone [Rhizobium oryzicola]
MDTAVDFTSINAVISGFGDYIGLPGLQLDDDGQCTLSFDETVLTFRHDRARGGLLLQAEITEIAAQADPSFFRHVLDANRISVQLATGTLAMDGDSLVWLDRIAAEGLTQDSFQTHLQAALDHIESWKALLAHPADIGNGIPLPTLADDPSAEEANSSLILRP